MEVIVQVTEGSSGTWTETSTNGAVITKLSSSSYTARATIEPGKIYTFKYDIPAVGTCPATSDTMTVTNSALPTTPDAGVDQDICLSPGSNLITLAGNNITAGSVTGRWSKLSGPAGEIITNPALYNSEVTGLEEGLYIFKWTASNGNCTDLSDVVRINAYAPPSTADAGKDQ